MTDDPRADLPPRRRGRAWRIALALLLALVVIAGGSVWWLLSESGLPFLVARVVAQSGGRLSIEGPSAIVKGGRPLSGGGCIFA